MAIKNLRGHLVQSLHFVVEKIGSEKLSNSFITELVSNRDMI